MTDTVVPMLSSTAADGDIIRQAMLFRAKRARDGQEPPPKVIVPLRQAPLFKGDPEGVVEATVIFYGAGPVVERPEEWWR